MVNSPLFVGEYELTIDEKSRLSIPADVRRLLDPERDGRCLFLTLGLNRKLWLYTEKRFEFLADQVPADIAPGAATLKYDQITFSSTNRVDLDKQGRILIPDKSKRRTGLGNVITLFGARDHLELWNRDEFDRFMSESQNIGEVAENFKQQRQADMVPRATI